jgi:hypothetical protein
MEYGFPKLMDLRTWELLRRLMARGIFLWIDAVFPVDVVVSFYRVVRRFASAEDHKPAIEWLVRGGHYYHTQIHRLRQYDIDIRDLSQLPRNCTLRHLPDLPHSLRLRISVGKVNSVERSNGRSIIDTLPKRTSHLDIVVMDSVGADFIPDLLQSNPNLRSLVINVYGIKPVHGQPFIFPSQTCTHATYCLPWEFQGFNQITEELEFCRGRETGWRHYQWLESARSTRCPFEKLPERFEASMRELRAEINGWFDLNPSLKIVVFKLSAGSSWCFAFNLSLYQDVRLMVCIPTKRANG